MHLGFRGTLGDLERSLDTEPKSVKRRYLYLWYFNNGSVNAISQKH